MGTIAGDPTIWEDDIYQFETTDVVQGGPDGIDNTPLKQLANRTAWLKNATGAFDDITLVTGNITLQKEDIFHKQVAIYANSASVACTLPTLGAGDKGTRVFISTYAVTKQVSIISPANNIIISAATRQVIYMGDMENILLVWTGDHWLFSSFSGNFFEVGQFLQAYSQLANTIIAQGQEINRADYPRLYEYANNLSGSIVTDFNWINVANNRGYFSYGNGSTTFRVPDLRAMFIRNLDLGAGIDLGRTGANAGAYEADDFKAHTHGFSDNEPQIGIDFGNGSTRSSYTQITSRSATTDSAGGLETRPKNIGLIPLLKI